MGHNDSATAFLWSFFAASLLFGGTSAAHASVCLNGEGSCSAVSGQGLWDYRAFDSVDSIEPSSLLQRKQVQEEVTAAACCASCGVGSYCSPLSFNCYDAKYKDYYELCGDIACCANCGVGSYCSPVSFNCYAAKFKDYYQSCGDVACCANCGVGSYCSPVSFNCYDAKNKNYYELCGTSSEWCGATVPPPEWNLFGYSGSGDMRVKVLTYNLFWWRLFGQLGGNGGSAGALIRGAAGEEPFDVVAFQECDNPGWIMGDAWMSDEQYSFVRWGSNTLAYRKTRWTLLADGSQEIAEDTWEQWYGRRGVQWVRLAEASTSKTLFVMNHHGPLPVNSGGICGGESTAYNMLDVVKQNSQPGDAFILTGDFNAEAWSQTVLTLEGRINRIMSNWVDHYFSNAGGSSVVQTTNLGKGGSDHDALMVIFNF